jgi:hypothetical protein
VGVGSQALPTRASRGRSVIREWAQALGLVLPAKSALAPYPASIARYQCNSVIWIYPALPTTDEPLPSVRLQLARPLHLILYTSMDALNWCKLF